MRAKLRRAAGAILAVTVAGLALVAVFGSAASAGPRSGGVAAAANPVVPVTGKVAGHGYAYWLQRSMQLLYSSSTSVTCDTVTSNGQPVGFLTFPTAPGTYHFTCSEPAGRPLYVWEAWNECSTFKGDHGTGTSDQQLMLCARNMSEVGGQAAKLGWKAVKLSATVDGKQVNLSNLLAATGVYSVQAVANNLMGGFVGSGRSAAYGAGLLLTGLAKGTHVIHSVFSTIGVGKWDTTFTVHVH